MGCLKQHILQLLHLRLQESALHVVDIRRTCLSKAAPIHPEGRLQIFQVRKQSMSNQELKKTYFRLIFN